MQNVPIREVAGGFIGQAQLLWLRELESPAELSEALDDWMQSYNEHYILHPISGQGGGMESRMWLTRKGVGHEKEKMGFKNKAYGGS